WPHFARVRKMGLQQIRKFDECLCFGFGRTGERDERVELAVQVLEIFLRQSVEPFAQLRSVDDFVDRVEQRQRLDRQPCLREQAQCFRNSVSPGGQGLDLEPVAVTFGEEGQVVVRDSKELAKKADDLVTAARLRHYY